MENDGASTVPKAESLAKSAFCLSVASLLCGVTAIPAIVQSIRALLRAGKDEDTKKVRIKAMGSLVFASLMLALFGSGIVSIRNSLQARADDINCVNHLKDLAVAMLLYEDDNQDAFPPLTNWCDALQENWTNNNSGQRRLSFRCPAASKRLICGYAMNTNLLGVTDRGRIRGDTVWLFECDKGWNGVGGPEDAVARHYASRLKIVSVDGTVKEVKLAEVGGLRWLPATNSTDAVLGP